MTPSARRRAWSASSGSPVHARRLTGRRDGGCTRCATRARRRARRRAPWCSRRLPDGPTGPRGSTPRHVVAVDRVGGRHATSRAGRMPASSYGNRPAGHLSRGVVHGPRAAGQADVTPASRQPGVRLLRSGHGGEHHVVGGGTYLASTTTPADAVTDDRRRRHASPCRPASPTADQPSNRTVATPAPSSPGACDARPTDGSSAGRRHAPRHAATRTGASPIRRRRSRSVRLRAA